MSTTALTSSSALGGTWGADAPASSAINSPASAPAGTITTTATTGTISLAAVPATNVSGMTADQIMPLLHSLQPAAVASAGRAHAALGQTLSNLADRLAFHAQTLAENWTGAAASNAVTSLQQVHAQTLTTAQAATQAGAVLNWLGNVVLPQFKNLPDPRSGLLNSAGGIIAGITHAASDLSGTVSATAAANATSAADTVARSYLTALNAYLVEANNNLPAQTGISSYPIDEQLRLAPSSSGTGARVVGTGAAIGRTTGSSPSSGRGATSKVGSTAATGGGKSSGAAGSRSPGSSGGSSPVPGSLQSAPAQPGAGSSPSQVVPGGPGSGIGDPGTSTSTMTGNSSLPGLTVPGLSPRGYAIQSGSPGASATTGEISSDASAPLASGAISSQDAAGTSGVGGASTDGAMGGGFPMMGGAPGQSDKERRRQAWMNEDEDIWGAPKDCVPSVIEGTDWIWKRK
jgi:hypothetical protein